MPLPRRSSSHCSACAAPGRPQSAAASPGGSRSPFVELDRRIEDSANLSLAEIFALHGEGYYRRLEQEALRQVLLERQPIVLATGGGLVTSPETYALLRSAAMTVWLRARPEDHWNRVVRQGDRRPMAIIRRRWRICARCSRSASRSTPPQRSSSTQSLSIARVVEAVAAAVRQQA